MMRPPACSPHADITTWAGKPLESRRLWHVYWYLGFDVEPSCVEKDYRE